MRDKYPVKTFTEDEYGEAHTMKWLAITGGVVALFAGLLIIMVGQGHSLSAAFGYALVASAVALRLAAPLAMRICLIPEGAWPSPAALAVAAVGGAVLLATLPAAEVLATLAWAAISVGIPLAITGFAIRGRGMDSFGVYATLGGLIALLLVRGML